MGSDLHRDDGFGIAVVRQFLETGVPEGVRAVEAGTAGIGLVQELMEGYEALVIVDAADRDKEPGTVFLLEAEVPVLEEFTPEGRQEFLADTHYTTPSKALILAKALDVLPSRAYILGCQPEGQGLGMGLSASVGGAVDEANRRLRALLEQLLQEEATTT
jgi:hydrogenase maturation protease